MVDKNFIRESNLIEGIDNPVEDERSWAAWEWLKDQDQISIPVLLELHKRITAAQLHHSESGAFRKVPVSVGGYMPPGPFVAQQMAYEWLMDLIFHRATLDPKEMHIRFEKIHPFVDGNGRTGRMLMWWHEVKNGQEPTLIRSNEADRHYYYQWFQENAS